MRAELYCIVMGSPWSCQPVRMIHKCMQVPDQVRRREMKKLDPFRSDRAAGKSGQPAEQSASS